MKCRVETGRWYGAFTSIYVKAPGDLDIDHLVPLKECPRLRWMGLEFCQEGAVRQLLGGPGTT